MREVLVTGPASPQIAVTDDLSGKTVHVRRAASYYDSLVALNARLVEAGKPAVNIVLVPDALEDEDMMEMLNTGLLQAIVVDDWKAAMWGQVLPKIKVHDEIVLRGKIGWAFRKGSTELSAEVQDFHKRHLKKQGVTAYRLKQMMNRVRQIKDPTGAKEWQRFEDTIAIFRGTRRAVRLRPADVGGTGIPGIPHRPECPQPRWRGRNHADNAGDRQRAGGGDIHQAERTYMQARSTWTG